MSSTDNTDVFYQWYKKYKNKLLSADETVKENADAKTEKWKLGYEKQYGRCLIAEQDIFEGEILFVDTPIVTGPKQNCEPLCLGCYKNLQEEEGQYSCSKCSWPLCSEECESRGFHSLECSVFTKAGYKFVESDFGEDNPPFESVLPLRCLLLRTHYPDRWSILQALESHNDLRRGSELWQTEQKNVCDFLHNKLRVEETDEEIHTAVGVLDVNCHEIRSNIPGTKYEYRVRGLYPLTAMMSHDCSSNTHHTVMEDMTMLVVASRNISKGSQITGTYTHLLSGTMERRKHLRYGKFFDCICDRCKDPTENDTFFSAVKCSRGSCTGYLLFRDPTAVDNSSDFACNTCGLVVKVGVINFLTNRIYNDIKASNESDPAEIEHILKKYEGILHPYHYHMISMKHTLSQGYGRVEGYLLNSLSPAMLQRKVDCCRHLLEVLDKLDPGISRLRGLTNYELHAPILFRANTAFQVHNITKPDHLRALKESLQYLENAVYCLKFEPPSSFEGEICKIARSSAKELKKWIKVVETLPESQYLPLEEEKPSTVEQDLAIESLLKKLEDS